MYHLTYSQPDYTSTGTIALIWGVAHLVVWVLGWGFEARIGLKKLNLKKS